MRGTIDLLPITKEKYISFTKHVDDTPVQFRFIDSFRFMNSSLDMLSSYLTEFPNVKVQFSELPEDLVELLTEKGVMPYDHIDSFDRFDESCLPPIDASYNKLGDKPCPRILYQRAQDVWNSFSCQTLGQYVDLYMKTDILLLADVFEQFRGSCLRTHNLDPAHYFTLPGLTWDEMLKYTKVELELLTDPDMFLFVERGIRGGLSQRKRATNEFEKNLFKLMNNAVFGKTMEDIRKRVNIKLLTKWAGRYGAEAYISKPEFKNCMIFDENLVAVELRKLQVYLNKPIQVGQAILDLAKTTIYDFHYGYMRLRFGDNCVILYTDTDSLIYEICNQDPYEIIRQDCHKFFDTSDYPSNNQFNVPLVNKKVLGMR
ncbi:uncharacterized protein [Leptinotarsa decemlineata]|uniref:uncharacterized protein n=1 Tax=Leptinotarsa decemlineata TaxID=7539 RepID=UPI003D308429